ncbi:MAG: hypothetical protein KJ906_02195 [Nanoarchaeota archaeon]|nr:hypothetical protein [Nanoarchaeota archaeon]
MRTLLYVPDIHYINQIISPPRDALVKKLNKIGIDAHIIFDEFNEAIDKCNLEIYEKIKSDGYAGKIDKLYMEGIYDLKSLPISDFFDAHLPEFKKITRGAELMVIEDKNLNNRHKKSMYKNFITHMKSDSSNLKHERVENKYSEKRTRFAEKVINQTLNNDEIGLLVFGAGHKFNFKDDIHIIEYDNLIRNEHLFNIEDILIRRMETMTKEKNGDIKIIEDYGGKSSG